MWFSYFQTRMSLFVVYTRCELSSGQTGVFVFGVYPVVFFFFFFFFPSFFCDGRQSKPVQKTNPKSSRNKRSICAKNNKNEQGERKKKTKKHLALVFFTSGQLAMQWGCRSDCQFKKKKNTIRQQRLGSECFQSSSTQQAFLNKEHWHF